MKDDQARLKADLDKRLQDVAEIGFTIANAEARSAEFIERAKTKTMSPVQREAFKEMQRAHENLVRALAYARSSYRNYQENAKSLLKS